MSKPQLTDRQKEVYELIRSLIHERGYGPTVREIGESFGIKSPNGVMCHLRALEKKGLITRKANKSRAIELTGEHARSSTSLMSMGVVSEQGTEAPSELSESIDLGKKLASLDRFVIQVSGSAHADMAICDGDHLIMQQAIAPVAGQLAAVRLSTEQVVLRRWSNEGPSIALKANGSPDINVREDDVEVLGVAVGMVRLDLPSQFS